MRNAKMRWLRRLGALALALCAASAGAFPVTWTLSGATFNDQGAASGSFVYDADTVTLSNWSIAVAGGDTQTFPPFTYDTGSSSGFYNPSNATTLGANFSVGASGRGIRVPGVSALTDAGGTIAINLASGFQGECYNCSPFRTFTAGDLVGTAAPTITSAASASFFQGQASTFTVTATGAPTPALTETGTLPSGITFVDNGNGTATLAGTPAFGTVGSYALTITASNGIAPDAIQNFVLTIRGVSLLSATPMLGTLAQLALLLALLAIGLLVLRGRGALR